MIVLLNYIIILSYDCIIMFLYYIILYYTILYDIILYYIVLYYIILYIYINIILWIIFGINC